ncbi:MAG: phospho-N-acetylmuramoyl-pentapeptide-transferase [Clostridiales bacterium]|nr:phospho-N-acetylmuramoyl-pentapeptide-transferase [Clostridiales bacterium]
MTLQPYILFALSVALMLLLMPKLLPLLKKMKFGQTIYNLGPQAHQKKQGTPNMGGILIGGITVIVTVLAGVYMAVKGQVDYPFFSLKNPLFALLVCAVGSMAIGFADDFIKDVKKRHDGLSPIQKLLGQLVVGAVFSVYCYYFVGSDVILPFTGKTWDMGIFYVPVMTVLVMFMTNSANLQDGVDGILSTVTACGMVAFGLIATLMGGNEIVAACCFALCGACVGFLRFNAHPARIFMGDTGSMFIGGVMVAVAMLTKTEFLLLLICFTCVMSSVSVMLQTTYFKITKKRYGQGRRIFKMSPIHHHFELCGMKEVQVVAMYFAVTLVLSAVAVLSVIKFF